MSCLVPFGFGVVGRIHVAGGGFLDCEVWILLAGGLVVAIAHGREDVVKI